MPYLVRHAESGYLVDPLDAADAAARFAALITDSELRRQQGEAAVAIARERFHPDQVARRTRAVYFNALSASASALAASART
jgi:glycosyltransferase involved in cell wall biosynthesis